MRPYSPNAGGPSLGNKILEWVLGDSAPSDSGYVANFRMIFSYDVEGGRSRTAVPACGEFHTWNVMLLKPTKAASWEVVVIQSYGAPAEGCSYYLPEWIRDVTPAHPAPGGSKYAGLTSHPAIEYFQARAP